jgi:hypothetical protein
MPGFNPSVTNGVDSVSRGLVHKEIYYDLSDECLCISPVCINHGAMNRVSKDGIYRCLQIGCNNGCYMI